MENPFLLFPFTHIEKGERSIFCHDGQYRQESAVILFKKQSEGQGLFKPINNLEQDVTLCNISHIL